MDNNDRKNLENPENFEGLEDIENLGILNRTDFENMEIMREDQTFATMVEEHISDEEMDELTRAFQDLEDKMGTPAVPEDFASIELDEGAFSDMSEDDLDAMLKSLMDKDDGGGEDWVPIENLDEHLAQQPEIYEEDGEGKDIELHLLKADEKARRRGKGRGSWLARQYREGDKKTKVLVSSVLAMSGLLVASLVFLFVVLLNDNEQTQGTFNVTPPSYAFNNASHALVNLSASLGDDIIVLNRILLDEVTTAFYFADTLDPARYIFALEDFNGRIYSRNLVLSSNANRNHTLNQTVVRFEAIDPTAEGFVISITDLNTGQTNSIDFAFGEDAVAIGRHIANPMELDTGISGVTIAIDHGTFSAASSSLNFSISYANPGVSLAFGEDAIVPPVIMRHAGATVPAMGPLQTSHFPQGNVTLGSIDFNPLRSLTGRVDLIFSQMYQRHEIHQRMSTDGMFGPGDDRARTITLDGHTINIHGMMRQGYFFVMPLYGVPRAAPGETAERVPTTMEVTLVGGHVRIPGYVRYDGRGTDVTFDTRGHEAILDIPRNNLYLEFHSISVRLPEFTASINLDDMGFEPSSRLNATKSQIEAGLAQHMPSFASEFGATQNVEYAVQVRQIHIEGDIAFARVTERLAFTGGGNLQEVIRHHSVTANLAAGNVQSINSIIESIEQNP